jgi:hypothetical protein
MLTATLAPLDSATKLRNINGIGTKSRDFVSEKAFLIKYVSLISIDKRKKILNSLSICTYVH